MRKYVANISIVLFFILMIFNFSNEPLPPPYHQFHISGNIICDTLMNKKDFTVTLYGKSHFTSNEYRKAFQYPEGINNLAITDSTGYYYLIASNDFEFDSIKTAVIIQGREAIFSKAHYVDKNNRMEIKSYKTYFGNESGCCQNVSETPTGGYYIERYEYTIRNIEIVICN